MATCSAMAPKSRQQNRAHTQRVKCSACRLTMAAIYINIYIWKETLTFKMADGAETAAQLP